MIDKTILLEKLLDVFKDTLEITFLVILMMSLIELVNVSSSGRLLQKVQGRPWLQVVIAALLGAIPGCAGGFAVVSMFTHDVISFGALLSGLVATFGDEAFFLFAKSPKHGFLLTAILLGIALCTGLFFNIIGKKWKLPIWAHKFDIHEEIDHHDHEHRHSDGRPAGAKGKAAHFFKEHIWEHVIKQHLPKVFFWSLGVLLFLMVVELFVDVEQLLQARAWTQYLMLLLAVLIGFIPQSGPNLIFIVLFLEGSIPFGILLANSISQNGHAGLPLLAQSRRNFFISKSITMVLGLTVGALFLLL